MRSLIFHRERGCSKAWISEGAWLGLWAVTAREKWKEPQASWVQMLKTLQKPCLCISTLVGRKLEGEEGRSVVKMFFKTTPYSFLGVRRRHEQKENHVRWCCLKNWAQWQALFWSIAWLSASQRRTPSAGAASILFAGVKVCAKCTDNTIIDDHCMGFDRKSGSESKGEM